MSPKKKITKKVSDTPKTEPKVENKPEPTHDWLPDEFEFSSNGVDACWAEPRMSPSMTNLNWIVIMASCKMQDLPDNWQKLVKDASMAGYYIDYQAGEHSEQVWKVDPPRGKPVPELPFEVKMT
tara:strand:+ start:157 stop:528 length:372 start_codon:yes stop_codon:yes gene_type:complete